MEAVERPTGLIIPHELPFDKVISPIKGELSMWCWWTCTQSGPFDSLWLYADSHEQLVDRLWIDVPAFHNTGCSAFSRGFVPKLHEHVILDEYTYYYASHCDPNEFAARATTSEKLFSMGTGFDAEFFKFLGITSDLFIMHIDGWWEIYTKNGAFNKQWTAHFPSAFARTWKQAGEPPSTDPL